MTDGEKFASTKIVEHNFRVRPSVCRTDIPLYPGELCDSIAKLDQVIVNGFNEAPGRDVIPGPHQCMTTASAIVDAHIGEKVPAAPRIGRPPNSMSQTNSALAMSQLGTVYATKRRRRNGKR